ncbi:MAG: beta-ketoacyl-ACP synthase II [Elusimicrobiota bacterium]
MSGNILKGKSKRDRRVVITGMGTINPLGNTVKETWDNALKGVSGIGPITYFDAAAYDVKIAGQLKNYAPDEIINKKEQRKMDLFVQYAVVAAHQALKDSGLVVNEGNAHRIGVYCGSGIGGLHTIELQHDILNAKGPGRITPFFIPMVAPNLAAGQVSMFLGLKGPNLCLATACATGTHALGEASQLIHRGAADVIIAGGSEAVVCPLAIAGFASMRALSRRNDAPTKASRPFDKDRDGFVLSEGSAMLVLEDYEHAKARNARIYAEITGYGLSADSYHLTAPPPGGEGAARAMRMALQDAEYDPSAVQYINTHGTATPTGDELECQAIHTVFGPHAAKLLVSSTKSMTGHLLGATGALESIFCVMAIIDGAAPPTINLDNPGPGCDLDFVPHTARKSEIKAAMNNSFGFGGTNASVIFSKI